jgi:hypothetical protein
LPDRIEALTILERPVGGPFRHKECAGRRHAITPDVLDQRRAAIGQEGETVMAVALAAHEDLACAPVDIVELQGDHFRWPQSKTGE